MVFLGTFILSFVVKNQRKTKKSITPTIKHVDLFCHWLSESWGGVPWGNKYILFIVVWVAIGLFLKVWNFIIRDIIRFVLLSHGNFFWCFFFFFFVTLSHHSNWSMLTESYIVIFFIDLFYIYHPSALALLTNGHYIAHSPLVSLFLHLSIIWNHHRSI